MFYPIEISLDIWNFSNEFIALMQDRISTFKEGILRNLFLLAFMR